MKHLKSLPALALAIMALLALSMAVSAESAADPNICDAEEFWDGECRSEDDWIAGWYLHPDNDPGDGSAVETAYANFAHVIVHMPHSMCIDWRTANCNGTIPPAPPETEEEARRPPKLVDNVDDCIVQANTQSKLHPYCQALYNYDTTLNPGEAGYSAGVETKRAAFVGGLMSLTDCVLAANFIVANSADYKAGNLDEAQAAQMRTDIVTVRSWTCVTHHNRRPPSIPDSPS